MLRIHFADLDQILTFDGEVLEVFYGTKSARVHIGHLTSIEVVTDRQGKQELHIETKFGAVPYMPLESSFVPQVNELVMEVRRALAAFRF
jgi:hypothetical protein